MSKLPNLDIQELAENIKAWGKALGFQQVGICDIDNCYAQITNRGSLIKSVERQSESIQEFYQSSYAQDFFLVTYEDFIQGNIRHLNNYINREISEEIKVHKKFKRMFPS